MGMFDVVMVPCPKCGELYQAQTKSGPCTLGDYLLGEAPEDVLEDVNRHAPFKCEKCGCVFAVEFKMTYTPREVEPPIERYEEGFTEEWDFKK